MTSHWSKTTRYYVLTIVLILLIALAWVTREMFGPLMVAGLIAYVLKPIVYFFEKRLRIRHKFAVALVYFITLGLLIALPSVLVPVFLQDIETVSKDMLEIVYGFQSYSFQPLIVGSFVIDLDALLPQPGEQAALFFDRLPENIVHLVEEASRNAAWFLVILVTIYYFLLDWGRVREWLIHIAPKPYRKDIRRLYMEVRGIWNAYLRGQLVLMLVVGVIFSVVWLVVGLPGAVILGTLTGLFSLVPEIGPLVAAGISVLVALFEGSIFLPISNWVFALLIAGIYLILINFKNVWLRPRIMGRSVNLNEGLVFVAIIAAVIFSGVLGALIIIPVLASTIVIARYLRARIFGLEPFPPEQVPLVSETETPPTPMAPTLWKRRKPVSEEDEE